MTISSDTFSKIAAGIQSVALVGGMMIGGLWTYVTYKTLVQREKAELEMVNLAAQKDKTELEIADIRRKIVKRINGNIELQATQLGERPSDGIRFIGVDVKIINNGTEDLNLSLDDKSLESYIVQVAGVDQHGNVSWAPMLGLKISSPNRDIKGLFIAAGGDSGQLSFVQQLASSGLYLVRVRFALSSHNHDQSLSAEKYIFIK